MWACWANTTRWQRLLMFTGSKFSLILWHLVEHWNIIMPLLLQTEPFSITNTEKDCKTNGFFYNTCINFRIKTFNILTLASIMYLINKHFPCWNVSNSTFILHYRLIILDAAQQSHPNRIIFKLNVSKFCFISPAILAQHLSM